MNNIDLPSTRLSEWLDPLLNRIGRSASWLWLVLLVVIVGNVVLRYVFDQGRIELEEIQWHLYSFGFLLALFYTYQADRHIRVDAVSERFPPRIRAWLELYGIVLALLPFITLVLYSAYPLVVSSWNLNEVSQAPGGLPMRWLVKAALPLGFVLLLLASLSRLSRIWAFLFRKPS